MAFAIRISGVARDHGRPIWSIDAVAWWPVHELERDERFRTIIDDTRSYVDRAAVLGTLAAHRD